MNKLEKKQSILPQQNFFVMILEFFYSVSKFFSKTNILINTFLDFLLYRFKAIDINY